MQLRPFQVGALPAAYGIRSAVSAERGFSPFHRGPLNATTLRALSEMRAETLDVPIPAVVKSATWSQLGPLRTLPSIVRASEPNLIGLVTDGYFVGNLARQAHQGGNYRAAAEYGVDAIGLFVREAEKLEKGEDWVPSGRALMEGGYLARGIRNYERALSLFERAIFLFSHDDSTRPYGNAVMQVYHFVDWLYSGDSIASLMMFPFPNPTEVADDFYPGKPLGLAQEALADIYLLQGMQAVAKGIYQRLYDEWHEANWKAFFEQGEPNEIESFFGELCFSFGTSRLWPIFLCHLTNLLEDAARHTRRPILWEEGVYTEERLENKLRLLDAES